MCEEPTPAFGAEATPHIDFDWMCHLVDAVFRIQSFTLLATHIDATTESFSIEALLVTE
jgi:hypothetical protein